MCVGGVIHETYKMQRMLFGLMEILSLRTSVFLISSWLYMLVIDNKVEAFSEVSVIDIWHLLSLTNSVQVSLATSPGLLCHV